MPTESRTDPVPTAKWPRLGPLAAPARPLGAQDYPRLIEQAHHEAQGQFVHSLPIR